LFTIYVDDIAHRRLADSTGRYLKTTPRRRAVFPSSVGFGPARQGAASWPMRRLTTGAFRNQSETYFLQMWRRKTNF